MRIYTTGSNVLWPIFIGLGLFLLIVIGLGGLLLTTPLGLAILAFWGLSSIYRSFQRRKFTASYNDEGSRAYDENYSQANWQAPQEEKATEDVFAVYRQEEQGRGVFTVDDLRNAEDVEYKEL